MAKRKKAKVGRRVYHKIWSRNAPSTRKEAVQEYHHRAQYFGPAQRLTREINDQRYADMLRAGLLIDKIDPTEADGSGDRKLQVKRALSLLERVDNMERHMIVHKGLRCVRILFYNKEATRWWFIERNRLTGQVRKSIDYGSREQAFAYLETESILFVE